MSRITSATTSMIAITVILLLLLLPCLVTPSLAATRLYRQGDALQKHIFSRAARQHRRQHGSRSSFAPPPSPAPKTHAQTGSKEGDRIVNGLPGQPRGVDFDQYAGYVTVDERHGRALFYYFAEAAGPSKTSKPLVLWLNGGPGCSSLGYGAMEELGPFRVMSDGKTLYRNPYAWNNVANVLFLESPAGVGFSYSNTPADYLLSGDNRTAADAYTFLVNWVERFPEYKGRAFYITGESYAGHYVPQLAVTVVEQQAASKSKDLNLKGIMFGNAVINDPTDEAGMYDYFWTHALISDETHDAITSNCGNFSAGTTSQKCSEAVTVADQVFEALDIYNIYAPLCNTNGLTIPPKMTSIENFDPCSENYVQAYLNNPDVQSALHANVTKLNYPWSACSTVIGSWQDSAFTVLPIIQKLLSADVRVCAYSGDVDGRVPVTSTRYSISQLKLPVSTPWNSWYTSTDTAEVRDVGGYSAVYGDKLTLATVRGAGHEVPSYQAQRTLVLAQYFFEGKPLPS